MIYGMESVIKSTEMILCSFRSCPHACVHNRWTRSHERQPPEAKLENIWRCLGMGVGSVYNSMSQASYRIIVVAVRIIVIVILSLLVILSAFV